MDEEPTQNKKSTDRKRGKIKNLHAKTKRPSDKPYGQRARSSRKLDFGKSDWKPVNGYGATFFKVTVAVDADTNVKELAQKIKTALRLDTLHFYRNSLYRKEDDNLYTFAVDEAKVACKIFKLCLSWNLRLSHNSEKDAPEIKKLLTIGDIASLNSQLIQRYDRERKHLDLSNLLDDMPLRWVRIYIKLEDPYYLQFIVDFITTCLGDEVESMTLSDNSLEILAIQGLVEATPNLNQLVLPSLNRFCEDIRAISDWKKLERIVIKPSTQKRFLHSSQLHLWKCYFPLLKCLENPVKNQSMYLPINPPGKLPEENPSKDQSYIMTAIQLNIVGKFVTQYFDLMDNRLFDKVLEMYADDCIFCLTCDADDYRLSKISHIRYDGDGIVSVSNEMELDKRMASGMNYLYSNYHVGKAGLRKALSYISKATRDWKSNKDSLKIEIRLNTPQLVSFVVTGYLQQGVDSQGRGSRLFYFERSFMCTVINSTTQPLLITNDQLAVQIANKDECKNFMKEDASLGLLEILAQLNLGSSNGSAAQP